MSEDNCGFVTWEEHIVCHERGRRVVHFYLKSESGDVVLAVVGTERSIRHMLYVVSNEYLRAFGSNGFINSSTKWRSRREVVEWLTSMVSSKQMDDLEQSLVPFQLPLTGPSLFMAKQKDLIWLGKSWICTKQLKHYPAFSWNESTISVYSFVLILSEDRSPLIAYLEDMYEDKRGNKKVKVRWFFLDHVMNKMIPRLDLHPREVFVTPHTQVIGAEYIHRLATVLTPIHYEQCVGITPQDLASEFYFCSRQVKNKKVKPFSLTKLRGYLSQSVLAYLGATKVENEGVSVSVNGICEGITFDHSRSSSKEKGVAMEQQELENVSYLRNLPLGNTCRRNYPQVKFRLSRKPSGFEIVARESPEHLKVDDKIELLCQDSGIRGCWFQCRILKTSPKCLRVQYDDVQDEDGSSNLEEWVPALRVAAPDRLCMRSPGRHTIRPRPRKDSANCVFEVGAAVDVWHCDGWWEGVVVKVNVSGCDSLQVYFPGEGNLLTVKRVNIRTSRDWVDNKWVDIEAKPEILHHLSALLNSGVKLNAFGCNSSLSQANNVFRTSRLEPIVEDEGQPSQASSDNFEHMKQTEDEQGGCDNEMDIDIHDAGDGKHREENMVDGQCQNASAESEVQAH